MKKFRNNLIFFCFSLSLIGCAGVPPMDYDVNGKVDYNNSYDEIWQALIDCLASENTPIKTIEKDSGIVATDQIKVPVQYTFNNYESKYCDCGKPAGFATYRQVMVAYNIFVKNISDDMTSVQINTNYHASLWFGNQFQDWISCSSKGYLEETTHRCITQKIQYKEENKKFDAIAPQKSKRHINP